MKKIKVFFKNNIKFFVGLIIGSLITGSAAYAAIIIQASNVGYTDTNSIGATNVQSAIEKLYTKCGGTIVPSTGTAYYTENKEWLTEPPNIGTIYVEYNNGTPSYVCVKAPYASSYTTECGMTGTGSNITAYCNSGY